MLHNVSDESNKPSTLATNNARELMCDKSFRFMNLSEVITD